MGEHDEGAWDGQLIDDNRPVLPDGVYEAAFIGHETAIVFQQPKVFLRFQIIAPDEFSRIEVYRAYRAFKLVGKPSKGGKFKLRPNSELFIDVSKLLQYKARPDRFSLRLLKHKIWKIKTRTVVADYKQRQLEDWMRYSVVESISSP